MSGPLLYATIFIDVGDHHFELIHNISYNYITKTLFNSSSPHRKAYSHILLLSFLELFHIFWTDMKTRDLTCRKGALMCKILQTLKILFDRSNLLSLT